MSIEHVVYSRQTALDTWVTPAKWLHAEECNVQSVRENVKMRLTGFQRALGLNVPGAKPVNGPLMTPFWTTEMGSILASFLRDGAITGTGPYDHGLVYDDALALLGLSMQLQSSAAVARNVLGAVVSKATLSFNPKERVGFNADMEAKDDAVAGGTWDFDGSASPAIVSPAAYNTLRRPFMFYDVSVTFGGTPTFNDTTNKYSIAGGTSHPLLRKLEVVLDHGVDTDGFGLDRDPSRIELHPGNRVIGVSLDRSWTDLDAQLATAWRAGTPIAVGIDVVGPLISGSDYFELHVCIPSLVLDSAQHPGVAGDQAPRMQTVNGESTLHAASGHDFGLWLKTNEATL